MSDLRTTLPPIPRTVWIASGVMALGGFLGNMDGSIVAVGLESMRGSFGVTLVEIQWVATAFLLGLSAALPLTPWLVRRLGAGLGLSILPSSTAAYASVDAGELGHATALVNIVLRVGGAVGGALCVIVLSRGLTVDPATGFGWAFGVLGALCVLGSVTAAWLRRAERSSTVDVKA